MLLKKVETYCQENNLSIHNFEKLCDLGNGTVGGWKNSKPNLSSLEKISKVMGISVCDLLKEGN